MGAVQVGQDLVTTGGETGMSGLPTSFTHFLQTFRRLLLRRQRREGLPLRDLQVQRGELVHLDETPAEAQDEEGLSLGGALAENVQILLGNTRSKQC